jgi:hypothetical protein
MQRLRATRSRRRRSAQVHKEQERAVSSSLSPNAAALDKLPPLLALPPELRVKVCSYLIQPDDTLLTALPLLHICKQIRHEAIKEFREAAKAFNTQLQHCYSKLGGDDPHYVHPGPHGGCICRNTGGCRWQAMMLSGTVEEMGKNVFTDKERLQFE